MPFGSILEVFWESFWMDLGVVLEWIWELCFIYSAGICYGILNKFSTLCTIFLRNFYVISMYSLRLQLL